MDEEAEHEEEAEYEDDSEFSSEEHSGQFTKFHLLKVLWGNTFVNTGY